MGDVTTGDIQRQIQDYRRHTEERLGRIESQMVPRSEVDWLVHELRRQGEAAQSERDFTRNQIAKFMAQITTNTMALVVGILLMLMTRTCRPLDVDPAIILPSVTPTSVVSPSEPSRFTTSPSFPAHAP